MSIKMMHVEAILTGEDVTRVEVAECLGCSVEHVDKILKGIVEISDDDLEKVLNLCGWDLEQLYASMDNSNEDEYEFSYDDDEGDYVADDDDEYLDDEDDSDIETDW